MSSYQPGIPTGFVDLDQDYLNIKNNFMHLDASFAINHYAFSDGTPNNGKHTVAEFPQQNPAPASVPSEIALYGFAGPNGTELIMERDGVIGTMTELTTSKIAAPVASTSGISWLPGAILIIFVTTSVDNAAAPIQDNSAFTFPNGGFPNNVFSINIQGYKASTGTEGLWVKTGTNTNTGFSIKTSASVGQFTSISYVAIGN